MRKARRILMVCDYFATTAVLRGGSDKVPFNHVPALSHPGSGVSPPSTRCVQRRSLWCLIEAKCRVGWVLFLQPSPPACKASLHMGGEVKAANVFFMDQVKYIHFVHGVDLISRSIQI